MRNLSPVPWSVDMTDDYPTVVDRDGEPIAYLWIALAGNASPCKPVTENMNNARLLAEAMNLLGVVQLFTNSNDLYTFTRAQAEGRAILNRLSEAEI